MSTPQLQRSVPEVLQDIVGDLQEIIRSEFRLAKTELKEEAANAARPAATFGVGLGLVFYGTGFLLLVLFTGYPPSWRAGWQRCLSVPAPPLWPSHF